MNINVLQAKINEQKHLLSHQKDCLERLLFQLEFNRYSRINVVGPAGSGRSTLALAVAELFSDHSNIALVNAGAQHSTVATQLTQQWFGKVFDPDISFEAQVSAEASDLPLLLLLDDADLLSEQEWQMLNRLPCLLVSLSEQVLSEAELILTLGKISLDDAEVLLKPSGLNHIEIADKYASANGNLNLLLAPVTTAAAPQPEIAPIQLPFNSLFYLVIAVALALLAFVLWPETNVVESSESKIVDKNIRPLDSINVADSITPSKQHDASVLANTGSVELASGSSAVNDATSETIADNMELLVSEDTEVSVAQTQLASNDDVVGETNISNQQDVYTSGAIMQSQPELAKFVLDEEELLNMHKQDLAVQLAVLSSAEALARFRANHPTVGISSYLRNWQGKVQWVVILAPYGAANEAQAAIAALPESLKNSGPFVKTLQAVQAEIRARQHSMQAESDGN